MHPALFYLLIPSFVQEILMGETAQIREIETMIRDMNSYWTEQWDEDEFSKHIHTDAVAIVPTSPGRLEGKDAYVAGWRGFAEAATIHEWKETGHKVQLYAGRKCAVVTYLFSISFTRGGQKQILRGRDMIFLIKEGRKWLVVADQFSPEPVAA